MSEERKPVVCPWCGFEMAAYTISIQGYSGEKTCFYECAQCCARSPIAITNKDAYAAATRRPPNRPLTLAEIKNRDDFDAIWWVRKNDNQTFVFAVYEFKGMTSEFSAERWAFAAKPTPEDIEAARNEHNG